MMCARFVFDRILNELKSRNADCVEGQMIGAAGVAHGERGHAEILEGFHPGFEDGRDGFVLLKINTANLTRAVVDVEIGGDFRLLRLYRNLSSLAAQERWHAFHQGVVHGRAGAEMVLNIALRAEKPLFFAAPEADADGAARLDIER